MGSRVLCKWRGRVIGVVFVGPHTDELLHDIHLRKRESMVVPMLSLALALDLIARGSSKRVGMPVTCSLSRLKERLLEVCSH